MGEFTLNDLELSRKLIRHAQWCGDESLSIARYEQHAAEVKKIQSHLEDLACAHNWLAIFKPLISGAQMYECKICKSRRIFEPITEATAKQGDKE